jgi:peroxygenase
LAQQLAKLLDNRQWRIVPLTKVLTKEKNMPTVSPTFTTNPTPRVPSAAPVERVATPSPAAASPVDTYEGPRPAPGKYQTTALAKHVGFFDVNGNGRITVSESRERLGELGVDGLTGYAGAAAVNFVIASMVAGYPALTIDLSRIEKSKHDSDSDVFDTNGEFDPKKFDELFTRFDKNQDGALDGDEISAFLTRNRESFFGSTLAQLELPILLKIAGEPMEVEGVETTVLSRERLAKFYDGSLFYELAGRPVPNWD